MSKSCWFWAYFLAWNLETRYHSCGVAFTSPKPNQFLPIISTTGGIRLIRRRFTYNLFVGLIILELVKYFFGRKAIVNLWTLFWLLDLIIARMSIINSSQFIAEYKAFMLEYWHFHLTYLSSSNFTTFSTFLPYVQWNQFNLRIQGLFILNLIKVLTSLYSSRPDQCT